MALALNVFQTVPVVAPTSPVGIYTAPVGYTGVVLLAQAANVGSQTQTVSFSHQRTVAGVAVTTEIIKELPIEASDTANLLPGKLVLLDEEGSSVSSERFAEWLNLAHLDSNPTNLVVGPPDGFSDEFKQSADQLISLSELTLTHEMAAALLMEQLYRASEINRGSAYHRN